MISHHFLSRAKGIFPEGTRHPKNMETLAGPGDDCLHPAMAVMIPVPRHGHEAAQVFAGFEGTDHAPVSRICSFSQLRRFFMLCVSASSGLVTSQ